MIAGDGLLPMKEFCLMARILIIDDDDQFRLLMKHRLERAGYETEQAPDGKIGIQLYQQGNIDLIVTDIIMPEKEGVEMILELRKDYPDAKIIAFSGGGLSSSDSILRTVEKLGANYVFPKPFAWEEMLAAIHNLLQQE